MNHRSLIATLAALLIVGIAPAAAQAQTGAVPSGASVLVVAPDPQADCSDSPLGCDLPEPPPGCPGCPPDPKPQGCGINGPSPMNPHLCQFDIRPAPGYDELPATKPPRRPGR